VGVVEIEGVIMNFFRMLRPAPAPADAPVRTAGQPVGDAELFYEPPRLSDLGHVRDLVLGSSSSGNADSNSQYYW
jgi:hypothetical protein